MAKERTHEDVSTDIQNLNEVYDAKFEELREARQKLDREYWAKIQELNLEWEQLIKQSALLITEVSKENQTLNERIDRIQTLNKYKKNPEERYPSK